jgi:glycosyltransferase involved in cell wall biosynthesis
MEKYKILVVPSDTAGVGHYRSINPHICLQEMFPDDFHVDIEFKPTLDNDDYLKKYHLIHCHRTLGPYEKTEELFKKLKKFGIKLVLDLDDYWATDYRHPAFTLMKHHNLEKKIINNLRHAEYISTTTPYFAQQIKKINNKVIIIPNAIDPRKKQFQSNPEENERIRVGWLGGSSHLHDLKLLGKLATTVQKTNPKTQMVVCGFDLRGTMTVIDKNTGETTQRPIKPEESVWYQYEKLFTNDYTLIPEKYKKSLLEFKKGNYLEDKNEFYRRVWTQPLNKYAENYNLFDISLAPLVDSAFNRAKSQLKVIEAGFHKKALIAQNIEPYRLDTKHGENCFLVDHKRNKKDWAKYVKTLINNPNMIEDMGEKLYERVHKRYDIRTVTKKRKDFYLKILQE